MIGQLTHEEEVGRLFNTRIRFGSLASGDLKGYYQGGSCKAAMNMARAHQSHSVIYENNNGPLYNKNTTYHFSINFGINIEYNHKIAHCS